MIVGIDRPATMTDDHPRQIDALFFEDPLLFEPPRLRWCGGVCRDGHTSDAMRPRDGAQHSFDAGRDARAVGRALENSGAHTRVPDPVLDLTNEMSTIGSGPPRMVPGPRKWKYMGTSL